MQIIALNLGLFILTVSVHIFLHRLLIFYHVKSFKTTLVFGLGFIIYFIIAKVYGENSGVVTSIFIPLFLSGGLLYLLLSLSYCLFYISPYLGEMSPTFQILELLSHLPSSKIEVHQHFKQTDLVKERLKDLLEQRYIKRIRTKYYPLSRGERLNYLLSIYRRFVGWESRG